MEEPGGACGYHFEYRERFYPAQYRDLARLLEPFLYEERTGWFSLNKDNMHRWLRRLCQ